MPEIKFPVPGSTPTDVPPAPVPSAPPAPPEPPVTQKVTIDNKEYTLDKDGNALGENGTIFKTKDEIAVLNTPPTLPPPTSQEVEIDGKVYKIDDKGNAVNEDGTVFMDKIGIDDLIAKQTQTESNISLIQKSVNIIPVDDKNNPIVYEDTIEGLASYINDVTQIRLNQGETDFRNKFFEENPDLYNVYVHKLNTGSIEGFGNYVDWSKFEVDKMDDAALSNMIIANLVRTGTEKNQADYLVKLIVADGKLKDQAKVAQTELVKADTDARANAEAIHAQQEADNKKATDDYWDAVTNSIQSGKLTINGQVYKLPQVYRIKGEDGKITTANANDFLNYIMKPVEFTIDGQTYTATQNEFDAYLENSKKTHENAIFEALRRFVKYDDSQFIAEQVRQETVKRIVLSTKTGSSKGQDINTPTSTKLNLPIH